MSPGSSSLLFSERPIRPLPKRRLRERLSPDVADSIQYPPAPQTTAPLFAYPYNSKEDLAPLGADHPNVAHRENVAELGQETSLRRAGLGTDQDDQSLTGPSRRSFLSRSLHDSPGHAARIPSRQTQARHPNPQPPSSIASSADGYDSFENSNNKKKRKIPTAGETTMNGPHVLNDLGALGVPSPPTTGDEGSIDTSGVTSTPYYQAGSSASNGQGISGPGRGRYGRVRNGRSPLRALSDPNSNWGNRTPNKLRSTGAQYPSPPAENSGIISSAIASAEKLPLPQGQENISLLHQEASLRQSPTSSTQFTFTFDPQNPVSWPGSDPAPPNMGQMNQKQHSPLPADYRDQYNSVGARAAQSQSGPPPSSRSGGAQQASSVTGDGGTKGTAQPTAPPKKPRRRGNPLLQAAKQRRRETEYQNYHHPPASEDIWICEFCEYERIFGSPPEALIRQYEIKDRRRRRDEAERRRLFEKAKMKSRKGKKASKLPAKNNATTPDRHTAPSVGQQASPHPPVPPPVLNDHDDDNTLHHHQICNEGGETRSDGGSDSEDQYDDRSAEGELPDPVPVSRRLPSVVKELYVGT
ncbi:hypothetical protein GGS23DRAFT_593120 [Durotheca rogersii]|uniref:uncharacterized protein n=1 Tax=Durotheca rogersii TaxID=419775 RepID=UPI002220624C|nr:uncharacterized protein GGS23DRAFT_593120 [Durotheca rogersii]KAI5867855.1 hypothetical protein GGS23DRAFT_593120 [Durotheca rogersii]